MEELATVLTNRFNALSDPAYGEKWTAYMRGKFVFHGIPAPKRKEIQKEWFATLNLSHADRWELVDILWDMEQREYQYVAMDLLKRTSKKDIAIDDLAPIEHLITTKSWWDTVDIIASNFLGNYFKKFPEQIPEVIEAWCHSDNIWLNRSCLIFQLKYKNATDFELLKDVIRQHQNHSDFFIQKAIGWSLRQYSKFEPEAVQNFIREIGLEGLAKREASKYL